MIVLLFVFQVDVSVETPDEPKVLTPYDPQFITFLPLTMGMIMSGVHNHRRVLRRDSLAVVLEEELH